MEEITRRNFLKGSAVAAGAAALTGLVGCNSDGGGGASNADAAWDFEADVVIAGTGAAGITAAIESSNLGSSVIIIEKAPEEYMGGNSRVAMQSFWTPTDADDGVLYIKEVAGDHLDGQDDDYLRKFCEYASNLPEWYEDTTGLAVIGHETAEYPIVEHAAVSKVSWLEEGNGYMRTWNGLRDTAYELDNITWMFETPLTDLVFDEDGACIGIEAEQDGAPIRIKAKQGVCLATGGFENNDEMKRNYLRHPSDVATFFCGTPYNTGDGQNIAIKNGLKLWHMNNCTQGCFTGTHYPGVTEEGWENIALGNEPASDYGWLWLDKYGKRFMNEQRGGQHGMARQDMFYFDGKKLEWPRLPMWLFFDQQCRENANFGKYSTYDQWLSMIGGYTWDPQLNDAIEAGLCFQGDTVEDIAEKMGIDPDSLKAELERYDTYCTQGFDPFGKVGGSVKAELNPESQTTDTVEYMRHLEPPYYAIQIYPIMVNTQGGPQHDKNRQLMRVDGTLVPRLYGAGECGSIWGWCYQGGANFGECMVSGRISAEEITAQPRWDEA